MYIKQNGTIKNNISGHEYFDSPEFLASSNFRSSKEHFSMKNSSNYMIYILISIAAISIVGAGIMYYKKKQTPPSDKQNY
jgi:hypothetical protein